MYKKRKPIKRKDKIAVAKLTSATPRDIALKSLQYYLLNPNNTETFTGITYVDEVVLLCLLKDIDVYYNDAEALYFIDGQDVSTSIDKLIAKGYIDAMTMKPNKKLLKRTYVTHLFADTSKFDTADKVRVHMDYWFIDHLETLRAKWKSRHVCRTLYKGLFNLETHSSTITFTTLVNICKHKAKAHTDNKPSIDFDHNLSVLEEITSVLLKDIQYYLNLD